MTLLAIDNGTQSVRALLFDLRGNLLAKARVPLEAYFSVKPGWAEQQPDYYWQSLCRACQELWQQPGVDKASVEGVALTTQRGTVINLDNNCQPLRPAMVWLDQRRAPLKERVSGKWGLIFNLLGLRPTIDYLQQEAESNWLRFNQPEIWQKTDKYVLLSGYLTYLLTGRLADSTGSQVGYLPFDYKNLKWAPSGDWRWQALGILPEQLPELVPPTEIIGQISREAAEATGIPAGLPLVAAAADKACEVLGAGGIDPSTGCLSYGTAATFNVTSPRYFEAVPMLPAYPSALPGAYNVEIIVSRGYWMVNWFKDEFGHHELQLAEERGVVPEMLFDELVAKVSSGSDGLLLQPYWSPGIRFPGPEARGAIIGFSDKHTRAHLYRAILEGLAYALKDGYERVEKRGGTKITNLRVGGGGSQSDAALQLTADIFGMPVSRPHVYEASGLGAAIDAAVGLKLQPSFEAAVKDMTRTSRTFDPDPRTREIYDGLYREVYLKMYPRLQPLYHRIKAITAR